MKQTDQPYPQFVSDCFEALEKPRLIPITPKLNTGQAKNLKTALRTVTDMERASDLLNDEGTEGLIESMEASMRREGRARSSIYSMRANVKKLSKVIRLFAPSQDTREFIPTLDVRAISLKKAIREALSIIWPDLTFAERIDEAALAMAMIATPNDFPPVGGRTKVDISTDGGRFLYLKGKIKQWTQYERRPQHRQRPLLNVLEKVLHLNHGDLSSKAALAPSARQELYREQAPAKGKASISRQAFKLPRNVADQLQRLIDTRAGGKPPALSQASFPLKKKEALSLEFRLWSKDAAGYCPTGRLYAEQVRLYFQWLHTDHGVPKSHLDLSMLLQDEIIELFCEHCREKGHVYPGQLLANYTAAMAKPAVGYLSRHHVPQKRFGFSSNELRELSESEGILQFEDFASWQAYEPILYRRLRQLGGQTNTNSATPPSKQGIQWIIEHPDGIENGIKDLWIAIDGMVTYSQSANLRREAYSFALVAAWLALELRAPLRIKNTAEIEILEKPPRFTLPQHAAFWVAEDGAFKIFVPKMNLKNGRRASKEIGHVSATIPQTSRAHPVIAHYLSVREALLIRRPSKYLFVQFNRTTNMGKRTTPKALGNPIYKQTERAFAEFLDTEHLGITGGICPHGMRHLVAQRILAKEPNNFRKAASALMDKTSTVIAIYGSNNHGLYESELDSDLD